MTSRNQRSKSQETCRNALQLNECPRKGVQVAVGILLSKKDPVASLPFRGRRGDGILSFQTNLECAGRAQRRRRFGLTSVSSSLETSPAADGSRKTKIGSKAPSPLRSAGALQICSLALIALFILASCSRTKTTPGSPGSTREVTDEAGRRIRLPEKIDRIVSLAPSVTEIVYAVGAGGQLVGNTEYCDYPAAAKSVAKVGDTMHPSAERIIALKPQIVLVSTASQLEAFTRQLDQQNITVYVTNPQSLEDVFRSIQTLGDLFGHHDATATVVTELRSRAAAVEAATKTVKPINVFYQVSDEPLYTIGREAFLTDLIRRAGGISVTAEVPGAFPRYSDEAALAARPDAIILPSGGAMATANTKPAPALKNSPAVLNNRIYKIDENHLQRPGPRLVDGLEELARALHPEAFK
jgi:cobalamin transport system substrate-binding protein